MQIQRRYPNLSGLGVVTVPWGGRTAWEAQHPAVDIANKKGTPIPSTVNGVVEQTVTGKTQGATQGFGNLVTVKSPNGDRHQFSHLDSVNVVPGETVQAGKIVGKMGNSGATYSPSGQGDGTHLDLRITSAYGQYKNPMMYLKNLL